MSECSGEHCTIKMYTIDWSEVSIIDAFATCLCPDGNFETKSIDGDDLTDDQEKTMLEAILEKAKNQAKLSRTNLRRRIVPLGGTRFQLVNASCGSKDADCICLRIDGSKITKLAPFSKEFAISSLSMGASMFNKDNCTCSAYTVEFTCTVTPEIADGRCLSDDSDGDF
jgi:hypothetical protein